MATDIATLGIEIELGNIENAVNRLNELSRGAGNSQSATQALQRVFAQLNRILNVTGSSTDDIVNSIRALVEAEEDAINNTQDMTRSMELFGGSLSRVQGLVAGVAAAIAGYFSVATLKDFAQRGVQLNGSIEQSVISIGSLITSMTKLTDAQGKVLEGQDKYNASQELAANLMKEIQILGLETTATTQELVQGVQSVMANALSAGLKLEQIPKFAVTAAQAMQTMGVPLQQMTTELEALLSGHINKSQDILAPKIFADITAQGGNVLDYVNRLRESGKLYDELMKRMSAFSMAGKDVANTLSGLMSNLEESIDVIAGSVTVKLNNSLKDSVRLFNDLFMSTDNGSVKISDDVQNIADALNELYTITGEKILSATKVVVEVIKDINSALDGVSIQNVLNNIISTIGVLTGAYVGLRTATVGFATIQASTFAQMARSSGVISAISNQFGLLGAAAARAGSTLLAALGGPVGIALTAFGAALGYIVTTNTAADEIASKYASSMDLISSNTQRAANATNAFKQSLEGLSLAELQAELKETQRAMESYVNGKWFEPNLQQKVRSQLFDKSFTTEQIENLNKLVESLQADNIITMSVEKLKELRETLLQVANETGKNGTAIRDLLDQYIALAQRGELTRDRILQLANQMDDAGKIAVTAAGEVDQLTQALNMLSGSASAPIDSLTGAIEFLQKYTKNTKAARLEAAEFQRQQSEASLTVMTQQAAKYMSEGRTDEARKLVEHISEFRKRSAEANQAQLNSINGVSRRSSSGTRRRSGGGSRRGLDQITHTEEALRKLRQEVQNLRETEAAGAKGYTALILSIEQGRRAALADAEAQYNLSLARKSATQAQAEQILELQKEKAELEAIQKTRQAEEEKLRTTADFHTQLAELTGDWSLALEYQNKLVEQQANDLRAAHPELQAYIDEWERLQKKQNEDSIDPIQQRIEQLQKEKDAWSGVQSAILQYMDDATNMQKQFERITDTVLTGIEDALVNFVKTGKLSFEDLANSFIDSIIRMQSQLIVSGLAGMFMKAFDFGGALPTPTMAKAAKGGVFFSSRRGNRSLSSYSNSIVTKPTIFGFSSQYKKYARGGVMGEAGPEAIIPLTRMSNGKLGVEATGTNNEAPEINITVVNQTGQNSVAEVQSQEKNNSGGMDIQLMIRSVVAGDIANNNGGLVARALQSTYGLRRQVRGV